MCTSLLNHSLITLKWNSWGSRFQVFFLQICQAVLQSTAVTGERCRLLYCDQGALVWAVVLAVTFIPCCPGLSRVFRKWMNQQYLEQLASHRRGSAKGWVSNILDVCMRCLYGTGKEQEHAVALQTSGKLCTLPAEMQLTPMAANC